MSSAYKSDLVDVDVHVHHETERAYLVSTTGDRDSAEWVPKSQCELERGRGRLGTLTLSQSLATEKGLV